MPLPRPLRDAYDDDWDAPPPRVYFSGVEILHLALGVVGITVAFSLALGGSRGCAGDEFVCADMVDWPTLLQLLPYSAAVVLPAFILHELAHKIVAQQKDMWAEFRANYFGLTGGIILTALFKVLLSVPGAVYIVGNATRRDVGVISIVGPMVNLTIGYAAFLLESIVPPIEVPGATGFGISSLFELIVYANAILAAFNMLPIGPLDGRKVLRWSWIGFIGMWLLIAALILLMLRPAL